MESPQKPPVAEFASEPSWTAQVQQTLAAIRPNRHRLSDEQLAAGRAAVREAYRRDWLSAWGAR